jgi:fibronectin type 3 domain-containing protein
LVLLISGCTLSSLGQPEKPKIDQNLEPVDSESFRTIPDITSVAFEWRKVDDIKVEGYHLYRAEMGKEGSKLKRVQYIDNRYTTHFVDTNLEPNTRYMYSISSAGKNDMESRPTSTYAVQTLPVLESVSFIQAISNMPRQVKILWRPHDNERIKYYTIERSTPTTAKWEKIDTLQGRFQVEYIDKNLEDNVAYMYRLKAHTFDDIASKPSEIVRAMTKPLPLAANNIRATNDRPRKIIVSWEPSETSDVIMYKIYSSNRADTGFSHLKSVSNGATYYEDVINEDGKNRFYKVAAIDKDGLESALLMNAAMGSTLPKLNRPIITLAQIQGERAIINWQAGDNRAQSFIVYKTVKEGFFNNKTTKMTGIQESRFEDKDIVRGVEYVYSVESIDQYGITSQPTQEVSLTLPKLSGK